MSDGRIIKIIILIIVALVFMALVLYIGYLGGFAEAGQEFMNWTNSI